MKMLVTGGAGFIGSELVRQLKNKHKASVLDNLSTGRRDNLWPEVSFYHGDLLDKSFVFHTVEKERPERIFHLGAQVSVPSSVSIPAADAASNVIGTINILEAAVKYNVEKVIYASTAAVYGPPQYLPLDEKHPVQPLSGYGISKYSGELYLDLYKRLYGLDYTVLRFGNVYGSGQLPINSGIVAILVNCLNQDSPVFIYGDGDQTRDFLYVKDVAAAAIKAINEGSGRILNIGTNTAVSINKLLHVLENIRGKTVKTVYDRERPHDIRHSVLDASQGQKVLNWQPRYSLEEGLEEIIGNAHEERIQKKIFG